MEHTVVGMLLGLVGAEWHCGALNEPLAAANSRRQRSPNGLFACVWLAFILRRKQCSIATRWLVAQASSECWDQVWRNHEALIECAFGTQVEKISPPDVKMATVVITAREIKFIWSDQRVTGASIGKTRRLAAHWYHYFRLSGIVQGGNCNFWAY